MSNIKNEVITKLRSDIRTKLDQIGAFVDNELADYIMVLVANQKTKYQMKDDLSLFLGAATDEFVNWLHSTLKQIQLNANQSDDKKSEINVDKQKETTEQKELSKTSTLSLLKTKTKHKKHSIKSDKKDENSNSEDITKDTKSDINDKKRNISESESKKDSNDLNSQQKTDSNKNENILSDKQNDENHRQENNEIKEQNDGEVVLHLNPDGGDIDELLQENDVNEDKAKEVIEKTNQIPNNVSLKRNPIVSIPSSTIGAVVINKPKELEEEDNYDRSRPIVGSVASVVRVTQRKSSVPIELQANKNLLLKAMKDANQSLNPNRKRTSNEVEYTPTPIKKHIRKKVEELSTDAKEELKPEDLRNYLNVSKKDSDKSEDLEQNKPQNRKVKQIIEYKENENEMSPQFVVTLDGVDHNKYLQNIDDRIIFDEEMDEEFIQNEDISDSKQLENSVLNGNAVNERCRYWPSCKNGDECEFLHPTTHCKTFPNCRFGDKCIYIHPNCKFDAMCSRRDCPFTHMSRRKIANSAPIISSLLPPTSVKTCKYLPNCKNPSCPYFHPKSCRFGIKCRSHNCSYIHQNISYSSQLSVPHPTQLKWKAKDHISEQLSISTHKDSKLQ